MSFFKNLFKKKDEGRKKEEGQPSVTRRENQPDVYNVRNSETRMNDAMIKARDTLDYFKESISSPKAHQQYFSLKAMIEDGSQVEHIWLTDVSYDESGNFFGRIGNEPVGIKSVKLGQQVGIPPEKISDWMILENGRLIGGYTLRVLRETMSDKEKEAFDRSTGMYIDEGADYYRHDFSTPEGAILCLEDAYDAKDMDRAIECKDFHEEAKLMLAKIGKGSFATESHEIVEKTAEALRLSFIKHMQDAFPSFKGIIRAFPSREYIDANHVIVTEVCFYPDKTKSMERLHVYRKDGRWKVLNPAR